MTKGVPWGWSWHMSYKCLPKHNLWRNIENEFAGESQRAPVRVAVDDQGGRIAVAIVAEDHPLECGKSSVDQWAFNLYKLCAMEAPLPQISTAPLPEHLPMGPWRDGKLLVIARDQAEDMPHRCMLCNAKVDQLHEESHPFPRNRPTRGAILATAHLMTTPRLILRYGRCSNHSRWITAKSVGMISGILCIIFMLYGINVLLNTNSLPKAVLLLAACLASAVVVIIAAVRGHHVVKYDHAYVWVAGFGQPFLQSLGHWEPGEIERTQKGG
ncbi:MAG: hypothetical protein JWL69_3563 [Phycisphaerales bacterium]|nr:hypothetical protein [Phycisphaerales bacterium]